ncbi:MAG: AI-2E family transporter [Cytophagaceae bacterium]|nr:AI-2E family transporter [Cytophagaceae bacterium]
MPEPNPDAQPFYHRLSHTLIALTIIIVALYIGQDIWVPLALSVLLAVLLRPIEAWLARRGLHKVLAISFSVLLAMLVLAGIAVLISTQISNFSDDWPKLQKNLTDFYNDARRWVRREYNVNYKQQEQYIKQAQEQVGQSLQGGGGGLLSTILGPLGTLTLLPIYVFLLMYYRTMLLSFTITLFARRHSERVHEVLREIKTAIRSYMTGLLFEALVVGALTFGGLMALGVQYAVLLGVITALLNLIPYIGVLIASGLTILVAMANSGDANVILGIVALFAAVQFIDNNFLVPFIVASKVKVNALISILGVLLGGSIAGVSGMFLSIPTIAILKIIFDRVEGLEPWGLLIGDDTPEDAPHLFRIKALRRKKKVIQEE